MVGGGGFWKERLDERFCCFTLFITPERALSYFTRSTTIEGCLYFLFLFV